MRTLFLRSLRSWAMVWAMLLTRLLLLVLLVVLARGLRIILIGQACFEILTIGVLLKRVSKWVALTAVDAMTIPRLGCCGSSRPRQLSRKLTPSECLRVLLTTTALQVCRLWLRLTLVSRTLLATSPSVAWCLVWWANCIRHLMALLTLMFSLLVTCLVIAWVVTWWGRARLTWWCLVSRVTPGSRAAPFELALLVMTSIRRVLNVCWTLLMVVETGSVGLKVSCRLVLTVGLRQCLVGWCFGWGARGWWVCLGWRGGL